MNSTPQPSRLDRLHQRLTQSKYWSLSLFIHAVLIAALSTLVIVQQAPTDDFVPEGDISGLVEPLRPEPPVKDPEKPNTDLPEKVLTATAPTIEAPPTQQPLPTLEGGVVFTKLDRTFKLPNADDLTFNPPKEPGQLTAPKHVPGTMSGRFGKDGRNHVVMPRGRPGMRPTDETENAVLRGLNWLRENQNDDGSWGDKTKGAMTGLALLSFLGHGETGESPDYGVTVNKALQWVITNGTRYEGRLSMTENGWGSGNGGVYEHGILTYALGEYFTLTRDERVTELLRQAIGHIVQGQGPDGGWMYHFDKTQSDTSVSGWQVQALKAAHLTKLAFVGVDAALDRAMVNLDRVQGPKGGYGYRTPGDRYSLTGVGVLCELFWKDRRDADLRNGVEFILEHTKQEPVKYDHEKADLYAWYYHTQAILMFGGSAWLEWERKFRPMAVKSQHQDGSWPVMKAAAHGNLQTDPNLTGAVYRTTLNILMLEAYYRYLPLNQAANGPDALRMAMR